VVHLAGPQTNFGCRWWLANPPPLRRCGGTLQMFALAGETLAWAKAIHGGRFTVKA